ncbi:SDR family oxidoreductase [Pseudonocardia sp. NPDC049154]|uniref:SDR family NAD(P)-dependent oxidoreductase n=1 Tax=Pseudonocardia sp. NPDC049154 TaxID=3155501 RepID=UPI00340F97BB
MDLTGHVALVTGGNSGIGLGMADGLARAGADVCLWGRNPEKNAAAVAQLEAHGHRVVAHRVDVAEEEQVVEGFARLEAEFGRLDSCFANAALAGAMDNPPYLESTLEDWRALMRVDLDGAYLTTREAARLLKAQGTGGSIVLTASLAAIFGAPREEAYAAAKGGLTALSRSLAVEFGKYGIRSNTLLPGWTRSPLFDAWLENPAVSDRIKSRIPVRRWGEPEDWAGIAIYLASPLSSFHTGDTFRIDGGFGVF